MPLLNDIIQPTPQVGTGLTLINEANDPDVDGEYVIGKVRGPFFFPNGISRNKRLYKDPLWENQLKSEHIKEKLASRTMYGTIGHSTELSEDTMKKGEFSHIISDLYIDPRTKVGIGEALILNTPAGRVLRTVLGAKSKLFVSSRADGRFLESRDDGVGVVDPETYTLHSFDFVLEPGFLQANPKLVESMCEDLAELPRLAISNMADITNIETDESTNKNIIQNQDSGGSKMSEQLIKSMSERAEKQQKELETLLEDRSNLRADNKVLKEENTELEAEIDDLEKKVDDLEKKVDDVTEKLTKSTNAYNKLIAERKKFEAEVGNPAEVSKVMKEAHKVLAEWKKFEKEVGTRAEVKEALEKSKKLIESYTKLGSVKEIEECLVKFDKTINKMTEAQRTKVISDVTGKYSVSESQVKDLLKKGLSHKDIVGICENLGKSAQVRKIYGVGNVFSEDNKDKDKPSSLESRVTSGSLGERLLGAIEEGYSRGKKK